MKKVLLTTLIVISACICMFILSCASELFYYGTTEKVMLSVPGNKIIVKYAPKVESENVLRKLEQFGKAEKAYEQVFIITLQDPKSLEKSLETLKKDNDVISANPIYLTRDKQEMGVTDEICLEFINEIKDNEKKDLLKKFKAVEVLRTQPWEKYFTIISVGKDQNALEVANRIKESGLVKFAHPNFYVMTYKHSFFPNDEFFPRQFYLHNTGQATNDGHFGTPDADIDAPEAWDITRGVNTITIAVLDEGVERTNNDLPAARLTILNGSNFAGGNLNDPDAAGDGAHGTCCAGIIAAEQSNTQGISGIAPLCRIMPVRIPFGFVPSSIYADAINFAWSSGADVLSNSWGYHSTADIPGITAAINNAITMGRSGTGSVVVWSAGNTANHNIGDAGFVSYPGCVAVANVITVGASDRNDQQANYSPTGAAVDVVAPSHRAYSCRIAGESFEVWSTDIIGAAGYNSTKNTDCGALPVVGDNLPSAGTNFQDYTGRMGGTSAACPEAAGVAALILSIHPTYTPAQVFSSITNSADKVGGYIYVGGRCNEMGFGRLNAFNALKDTPKGVFFSTEEDFVTQGPKPDDGNPIISDGDLLNAAGYVYMRNYELLSVFEGKFDLGLDAADVIDIKDRLVVFSTELDHPKGLFTAGDLLATNGAILPNSALLIAFDIPRELDLGLDALHFIGKREAIIEFLEMVKKYGCKYWLENPKELIEFLEKYGIDIWFSTEGTAPKPEKPRFLNGDLLSAATGDIVAANSVLLPPSVPAGILERGVDFGLDAYSALTRDYKTVRERGYFSTEILYHPHEGGPNFTDGDVLRFGDGVAVINSILIDPFEPFAKFLGLDALSIHVGPPIECINQITEIGGLKTHVSDIGANGCANLWFPTDHPFGDHIHIWGTICDNVIRFRVLYDDLSDGPDYPNGTPIAVPWGDWKLKDVDIFSPSGCSPSWPIDWGTSDPDGWYDGALFRYYRDLQAWGPDCNNDLALTSWNTGPAVNPNVPSLATPKVPDGLYAIWLEWEIPGGVGREPVPHNVLVDDHFTEIQAMEIPAGKGHCPNYSGKNTKFMVRGQFSDKYFWGYQLVIDGDCYRGSGHAYPRHNYYDAVPESANIDDTGTFPDGSIVDLHKVDLLDIPPLGEKLKDCAYSVKLKVWDRTIVGRWSKNGGPWDGYFRSWVSEEMYFTYTTSP